MKRGPAKTINEGRSTAQKKKELRRNRSWPAKTINDGRKTGKRGASTEIANKQQVVLAGLEGLFEV